MCPELQHRHLCLPLKVKLWFVSFPWMDCKLFSALIQFLFPHLFPKWNNTYQFHWLDRGQQLQLSMTLPNYTTKDSLMVMRPYNSNPRCGPTVPGKSQRTRNPTNICNTAQKKKSQRVQKCKAYLPCTTLYTLRNTMPLSTLSGETP